MCLSQSVSYKTLFVGSGRILLLNIPLHVRYHRGWQLQMTVAIVICFKNYLASSLAQAEAPRSKPCQKSKDHTVFFLVQEKTALLGQFLSRLPRRGVINPMSSRFRYCHLIYSVCYSTYNKSTLSIFFRKFHQN